MRILLLRHRRRPDAQSGVALVVVMVVMVIMTMLGIVLMLRNDTNQLLARNERDIATCREAAEAATRQGVMLTIPLYSTVNRFTAVFSACDPVATPDCPASNADLAANRIADRPGVIVSNAWDRQLFIASPNNPAGNVYVSVYLRNNPDDPLPATPADQYKTDSDSMATVVGEAEMTVDGAVPLLNRSNVRVRKMVAADIRINPGDTSGQGYSNNGKNTGTSY